jgi:hypothetical protein
MNDRVQVTVTAVLTKSDPIEVGHLVNDLIKAINATTKMGVEAIEYTVSKPYDEPPLLSSDAEPVPVRIVSGGSDG